MKFDLFDNAGEGTNSTGLYIDGASPTVPAVDLTNTGIDLHSPDVFLVNLSYDGTTLTETITDTATKATFTTHYTVNIPAAVGSNVAYVGFGGGTGGLTAVQDILNWTYTTQDPGQPNGGCSGGPDTGRNGGARGGSLAPNTAPSTDPASSTTATGSFARCGSVDRPGESGTSGDRDPPEPRRYRGRGRSPGIPPRNSKVTQECLDRTRHLVVGLQEVRCATGLL